jgi:glycosyltransferase involved in cell wall biosynthesis
MRQKPRCHPEPSEGSMHLNSQCEPAGHNPSVTTSVERPGATTPAVSVVMCTYNGERFLRPAIESILNQTFSDFELTVVDDGSADSTPRILAEFQAKDARLIVLTNPRNLGIAAATNKGLALARGQYVALQDHDDISLPHRFQTQVDYLDSHPEIALLGSAATLIDENGVAYGDYAEPQDDIELKWESLFRCPIRHTSVMVRRSVISEIGGYSSDSTLKVATDYDLLSRIVLHYRVANLNDRLVMWRRHPGAASIRHDQQQLRAGDLTSLRNIRALILKDDHTGSESDQYRLEGTRAFLCTPAGQLPSLPPEQIISGLRFLGDLFEMFSRTYGFSSSAAQRLRRHLNWIWGKHAVALAVRSPWDLGSRVRMSILGIRCVRQVARRGSASTAEAS